MYDEPTVVRSSLAHTLARTACCKLKSLPLAATSRSKHATS
jgi:hypothetical protein